MAEETSNPNTQKSTHSFEAEVEQVLRLVINSLYSNREIFLRELLSNASDALDKLRFRALTAPDLSSGQELKIRIIPDEEAGTLTLWDNGVGMSREEMITNLGTVAKSGSRELLEKVKEAQAAQEAAEGQELSLIGQFGVGFYSSWLVADRVSVISRAAGSEEAHRWESDARSTFTVEPAEREVQGTSVILHLAKEHKGFLGEFKLRSLVERYSDYLSWPIELAVKKKGEEDEGGITFEAVNRGSAIWQRNPKDVDQESYDSFYRHISGDWDGALAHRHFKIEGMQLFAGLLFVPKRAGFDLFMPEAKYGLRLYVRRVLIMEHAEDLLPRWLRFLRGVVDSDDLPLNVSRELLQDSRQVQVMRKQVIKQTFEMLTELAEQKPEDYKTFFKTFGLVLKESLHTEPRHKDRVAPLLRYETDKSEELLSLAEYKERMKEGQKAIYYALGESRTHLLGSPHIEGLKKRGYEILFMTDPVDQFAVAGIGDFEGLPLVSATNADLKLDEEQSEEEKEKKEEQDAELLPLRDHFRARLQDHVSEVRTSDRLTDSPVCLVIPEGGLQPHIERLLRVTQGDRFESQKRILEINPDHPIIRNLKALFEKDRTDARLDAWVDLLYDQALIAEGSPLQDPSRFARRMTDLLTDVTAGATD